MPALRLRLVGGVDGDIEAVLRFVDVRSPGGVHVGASTFTLVFTPLLLAVLVMATIVTALVVEDGDSTWFEGAALLGLYVAVATAFWWG